MSPVRPIFCPRTTKNQINHKIYLKILLQNLWATYLGYKLPLYLQNQISKEICFKSAKDNFQWDSSVQIQKLNKSKINKNKQTKIKTNLKFFFKPKESSLKASKKWFKVKKWKASLLKLLLYYLDKAKILIYLKLFH